MSFISISYFGWEYFRFQYENKECSIYYSEQTRVGSVTSSPHNSLPRKAECCRVRGYLLSVRHSGQSLSAIKPFHKSHGTKKATNVSGRRVAIGVWDFGNATHSLTIGQIRFASPHSYTKTIQYLKNCLFKIYLINNCKSFTL